MSQWECLLVPDFIIKALNKAGYTVPTPIQKHVLPLAILNNSDILGAAPTGSGKTIAYGIPLILNVLRQKQVEIDTCTKGFPVNNEQPNLPKISKRSKVYSGLDLIEELDVETRKVRAVHSVVDTLPDDRKSIKPDPILESSSLSGHPESVPQNHRLYGLVLLPTRELAVQVCQHLRVLTEFTSPKINIEIIVGGISIEKQMRLLNRCPDIIVATPGRLWQFIERNEPHVLTLRQLDVLVVDEADRLVEANHFVELRALLDWFKQNPTFNVDGNTCQHELPVSSKKRKHKHCLQSVGTRQTLIFSATLTFVHHGASKPGTKGSMQRILNTKVRGNMTTQYRLKMLRDLFGLRKSAKVIDLSSCPISDEVTDVPDNQMNCIKSISSGFAVPEGLREFRLLCPDQMLKDVRLFWFLAFGRYQEYSKQSSYRCLIFLNSKAGVRRLAGLLRQLALTNAFHVSGNPTPRYINVLHADMIQKQRLRSLERFQTDMYGILLASDVAARGLDLLSKEDPNSGGVAWVIHFEVPHTAELYIHRRGRTARANRPGASLLLLSPKEVVPWRRLAASLKIEDLPDLEIDMNEQCLIACTQIIELARRLDSQYHANSRLQANKKWYEHAAKQADIQLDSESEDEEGSNGNKRNAENTLKQLTAKLTQLVMVLRKRLRVVSVKPKGSICRNLLSLSKLEILKRASDTSLS